MLNLIKLNENKKIETKQQENTVKHFASSVRIWDNSIYVFNKNALKTIPVTTKLVISIIKSYFTIFNQLIEKKVRTKRLLFKLKRLSTNKIFISNGEFKHTNNKVIITLYMFNRQKSNYLSSIKKWYLKKFFLRKKSKKGFNNIFYTLLKNVNKKGLIALNRINSERYTFINVFNNVNSRKNTYLPNYIKSFYKKLLSKWTKKLLLYIYYKQLIHINKSKNNYNYLQYLKKHLENVYNKNVEFNLINIKRFYLNSDILSETIAMKITKNRKKIFKYIKLINDKIKLQNKKIILGESVYKDKNLLIKNNPYEKVINNLKYKHLTGFRLEASGRLTRRYTASRSVTRVTYKGNLLDIDSTRKGLSTLMLKGNLESNLQYTKLSSTTRIGSFGIKGWISGN